MRNPGKPISEVRLVLAPKSDPLERILAVARTRRLELAGMYYAAPTMLDPGEVRLYLSGGSEHSIRYLKRVIGVVSVALLSGAGLESDAPWKDE